MSTPAVAETERPSRRTIGGRWDLPLLLLAYVATFAVRFLWAMDGTLHWEETLQPTSALLLLDDFSFGSLIRLQYVSWCGGCAAETLLYMPLAWMFDGALVSWKLVPLGFGLLVLTLVHGLAARAGGRVAGLGAGIALVLSPTFYMQNRMHAWANHFEGAAFVLGLLGLWLLWLRRDSWKLSFSLGLVAGLGFWFCYSTAFALPVLALLALVAKPRRMLVALAAGIPGLLVGLLPWAATQWALRDIDVVSKTLPWTAVYGMSLADNLTPLSMLTTRLSDLTGPVFWRLSVHHGLGGTAMGVGMVVWLVFVGAVLASLLLGARWLRAREEGRWRRLGLGAALLVIAYLALNLAVTPYGVNRGDFMDVFSLRYLSLSFPLQALCLGLVVGWLWDRGRPGRVVAVAMLVVSAGSGLLDMGFTVAGESFLARAPRLSAVRVDHNICGRLPSLDLPEGQEPTVVLERTSLEAPSATAARRLAWYRVGNGLGFSVTRGRPSDWAAAMGGLTPADRTSFLEGVACTLWTHKGLSGRDWVPSSAPLPSMKPLLSVLEDEAAADLSEKSFVCALSKSSHVGSALWSADLGGLAGTNPGYSDGLARQLGRLQGWRHVGPLEFLLEEASRGDPGLPASLRDAYVWGLGCMVGERWGHAPDLAEAAMEGLPPADWGSAREGLASCAAETYRWPRVSEGP